MKGYRVYIRCRQTVTCSYFNSKPHTIRNMSLETDVFTHNICILYIKFLLAFHKLNIEETLPYKMSSNQSFVFKQILRMYYIFVLI